MNMNESEVKRTAARIEEILTSRKAEIADREKKIREAKEAESAAQRSMDAATIAGDTKAYQKAKSFKRDAEDALEMHTARLTALNDKPLITDDEYKDGVSGIMDELQKACTEDKKKVVELVNELQKIADSNTAALNHGNNTLHTWQHTIYREADMQHYKNGYILPSDEKQFRDYSVRDFIIPILESPGFQAIKTAVETANNENL